MRAENTWRSLLIVAALGTLGWLYYALDPSSSAIFPSCPFRSLTGWLCPGCGSQRAIHHLLHGELAAAFGYNPLLVLALPYLLLGALREMRWLPSSGRHATDWLYHGRAPYLAALIIVLYWVGRNVVPG